MIIFTAGVEQIRETYLDNVPEGQRILPLHQPRWPGRARRHRRGIGKRDSSAGTLKTLGSHQILWYTDEHLAAFLKDRRVTDIYLFTFADLSSFHAWSR